MTYKHAIETAIDLATSVGVLRAGVWPNEQSHANGNKPMGEFTLRTKFPAISETNLIDIHSRFNAHNWEDAVAGEDYYITATANIAATPARPSPNHAWDWATHSWQDMRALETVKESTWAAMKLAREATIDAPLATPYGAVDSKAKDRTNITDAVLLLQTLAAIGQPTTIDFTMADNTTVTLDTTQMVTVGLLLGQKVQTAHSRARVLRAAIDDATTIAQLEALTWEAT